MTQGLWRLLLAALITFSAGCATVDFDAEKPTSHALADTGDTYLGKLFAKHAHHPPN